MTDLGREELVNSWKAYADKVKANKEWADTEEAMLEYQELLDKTFEIAGV